MPEPNDSPYLQEAMSNRRRFLNVPHSLSTRLWLISGQILLCAAALVLSARGITSEGTVSLQGDMPRYLMNGVFFLDLIHDAPIADPLGYTYRYYARYPALSLGHHPILLAIAEVPFYLLFGVSVFAGRMTILFFVLIGVLAWFHLCRSLYDDQVAFFASLLLVTTPYIVAYSQIVLSEIPTLSLALVSVYWFNRYCDTARPRDALLSALAFVLSAFSKQLAVLFLPIFVIYFLLRRGIRALLNRNVALAAIATGVFLLPLVALTLKLSPSNVAWVVRKSLSMRASLPNISYYAMALWNSQLTLPVLFLSVVGTVLSVLRRDQRIMLFVLWIAGFYVQLTAGGVHNARYAIYWIPPFCLLATVGWVFLRTRPAKVLAASALVAIAAYQCTVAWRAEPAYAEAYEEAAKYVIDHQAGDSVLFSAAIDSGFFTFFVRKHDRDREMIVLLADKLLATSYLWFIVAEHAKTREEIYEKLDSYGVGYVVVERTEYTARPLALLIEELHTENFALRKRIPIRSNSKRLEGVDLDVYEYLGRKPAKHDQQLVLGVPLMQGQVVVRFGDLLEDRDQQR